MYYCAAWGRSCRNGDKVALPGSRHFGANGFLQQLQLRMRLSSTAFYRGIPWFSTMAPLLPKCHLIPVSTTTTPSKIGDQSSTVTLISPGKKPASSTVFLSALLNLVYFLFFYYTILVQFFFSQRSLQTPLLTYRQRTRC